MQGVLNHVEHNLYFNILVPDVNFMFIDNFFIFTDPMEPINVNAENKKYFR